MCTYLSSPRPNLPMIQKKRSAVPRLPSLNVWRMQSFCMSEVGLKCLKVSMVITKAPKKIF